MIKEAVIVAGGLGLRFGNRTEYMPKGFIEIGGKPMVVRSIEKLIEFGIEKIIIGTGHCNEWYDRLKDTYPEVVTVRNENYMNTSSMGTLAVAAPLVTEDFFLLESDLIYDKRGLEILTSDSRANVILASGPTGSGDEVYLSVKDRDVLDRVGKDKTKVGEVKGELVGISKLTRAFLSRMLEWYNAKRAERIKSDYESVFAEVCAEYRDSPIYVRTEDPYCWTEVDDETMLSRAMKLVYPAIEQSELRE